MRGSDAETTFRKSKKIIKALEERGATAPCPRCGNNSFSMLDGYISHSVQTDIRKMVVGGTSVPTAAYACSKCGYIMQHALGVLELLPEEKEGEEKDDK